MAKIKGLVNVTRTLVFKHSIQNNWGNFFNNFIPKIFQNFFQNLWLVDQSAHSRWRLMKSSCIFWLWYFYMYITFDIDFLSIPFDGFYFCIIHPTCFFHFFLKNSFFYSIQYTVYPLRVHAFFLPEFWGRWYKKKHGGVVLVNKFLTRKIKCVGRHLS